MTCNLVLPSSAHVASPCHVVQKVQLLYQLDHVCLLKGYVCSTPFLVAKLCSMGFVACDEFSEVEALNWIAIQTDRSSA